MAEAPGLRAGWRDRPHPRRLSSQHARHDEVVARHREAVEAGLATYADPVSGLSVFTSVFLARRGYCCDSGCRHCPYVGA